MFTAALFTVANTWKKRKCPSTDEWVKKIRVIYTIEHWHVMCMLTCSVVSDSL